MAGIIAVDMSHTHTSRPAGAAAFSHTRSQFEDLADLALAHARRLGASDAGVDVSEGYGLSVESTVPLEVPAPPETRAYLRTKKRRLGHRLRGV